MAVVIGSSVNGDTIELAFLDLLPKLGVEIFTLEDLYPRANFSIGKMLSVAGLEDVVLDHGKLRHRLHVVVDIALADQAVLGEVITGLLNLFPGVIVTLGIVDIGFH